MTDHERAYWLADKIPAYGDYAKEAACVLRKQADEIDRLTRELADLKADRDSWIEQASARAQETVEAMQQVEAYRLRCEALHSAPQEPPSCPEGHGTMAGYFGGWRCNYCGCKAGAASGTCANRAASAPQEPREPLTTRDVTGPLVNQWAKDEYVQFVNRSDGQRTTATVSRDALLLLADRAIAAGHAIASQPVAHREPLTDREVIDGVIDNNCTEQDAVRCDTAFIRGTRFAERAHGIGADAGDDQGVGPLEKKVERLDALLRAMQADMLTYLTPGSGCGADWFVSRMLWHLDGPQQRAAQGDAP